MGSFPICLHRLLTRGVVIFPNYFDMTSYLQDHFILIVSEFLYIPWKYAQEQAANRALPGNGELCTPTIPAAIAESFELQMAEELKKKVPKTMVPSHRFRKIFSLPAISKFLFLLLVNLADWVLLHI